jgi:DNA-binding NarL/FixJ family response regulator
VIAEDMNLTETDASDETRLARRRLVQAAAAVSLAGGVGALIAAQPARADERGHHSNVAHHSHTALHPAVAAGLTPREREVLVLVAEGQTNKAIAEALFIAPSTVKYHVTSLLTKLDAATRTQLVTRAAARGLLLLQSPRASRTRDRPRDPSPATWGVAVAVGDPKPLPAELPM